MERRLVIAATLVAFFAATPSARAQFQPIAVRLPGWGVTRAGVGAIGGLTSVNDLLLMGPAANPTVGFYPDRDLWTRGRPSPYAIPGAVAYDAVLDGFDGGAAPDLVWEVHGAGVQVDLAVAWGSAPAALERLAYVYTFLSHGLSPLALLPRAQPLLVSTYGEVQSQNGVCVLDLKGARGTAAYAGKACFDSTYYFSAADDDPDRDRVHAVRASPAAVTLGVSDGAIPLMRGFRLLWNGTQAGASTLGGLVVDYLNLGAPDITAPYPPGLLEPGLTLSIDSSCFGVGGLDVDGDGAPDLVFTMRESPGKLLWLRNGGTPAGLATEVWHDLTGRADLQPLLDPRVLRQLDLAGVPAVALHDAALDEILVISGDGASGFTVQRLPAFGGLVKELRTADVVGTSARDLLAWVTAPGGGQELWVYPDDADPTTYLGWAPAPPATAPLGSDLSLSVAATDPGGIVALLSTTPTAASTNGETFTLPGSALCEDSTPVSVSVEASILRPGEDLGQLQRLQGGVSMVAVPTLRVAGSGAPDRLVLGPGEAAGRSEGVAWPACQLVGSEPAYTWGEVNLPGLAITGQQPDGSATAWMDFTVPETDFPDVLSGAQPPALTLTASGPTTASTGNVEGTATLTLELDARTLVAASVAFDRAVLAPGEVGTARITLASRIGLPLPRVRAEVRLAGLVLAGPLEVSGALAAAVTEGTVTIDPLPASPATVELEVAVRSFGMPGGVAVEVFSEGGHRLSPESAPAADAPRLPGCGCGERGGAAALPLLLIILFKVSSPLPHRGRGRGGST